MVDLSARLAEEKIEAYRELLEFFQRRFRPPTKQEQFVLLLSLWIRRHVRMPVEEDIKRLSGISLRQIERLFRREIGCSMRTFLMKATGSEGLVQAVQLAGLIWVGFVAAVIGPMYAYRPFRSSSSVLRQVIHSSLFCSAPLFLAYGDDSETAGARRVKIAFRLIRERAEKESTITLAAC